VLLHTTVKNEFIRYGGKSSVHSHLPNPSASEIRFFGGPFLRDFIYGGHFSEDHFSGTLYTGTFYIQDIFSRTKSEGHFVKDIFARTFFTVFIPYAENF
jgi:hypothetical protein